jgi:hypothetical protein
MGIDRKDIRDEERMDEKVSVKKDLNRVADGDIGGVLRDDIEEMKSDWRAADDKVERAIDVDDDNIRR